MTSRESLIGLYGSYSQHLPCLLPDRIREAMVRCTSEIRETPRHSEDDSTPEYCSTAMRLRFSDC